MQVRFEEPITPRSQTSVTDTETSFASRSLSREDSTLRHSNLLRRWLGQTDDSQIWDSSIFSEGVIDIQLSSVEDTFGRSSDLPFTLPFNVYEFIEKEEVDMDGLIIQLKTFTSETDHTEDEWSDFLCWNNGEILRIISTHSDSVSDDTLDVLIEILLSFIEPNPRTFCPLLISSTLMTRLFISLDTNVELLIFKRLQLLYTLFSNGGLAFPDVNFADCQYLIDKCLHSQTEIQNLALRTGIVAYFRMSSDALWQELNQTLSPECKVHFVNMCNEILEANHNAMDSEYLNIEASLEWIACCFHYEPCMYFTTRNFQQTHDVILANLIRFVAYEELTCLHVQCLGKILNWEPFFDNNYRVDETMNTLENVMSEGGRRQYLKVCEISSQILNEHLDRFFPEDVAEDVAGDGGDVLMVFE